MTASQVFDFANMLALTGWIVLGIAVWRRHDWLRDTGIGLGIPLVFSITYVVIMVFFFARTEGGFNSLSDVKMLFQSDWLAVAGWLHYLAFDLFVGSWIAQQVERLSIGRIWLVALFPLTFLFGPIGFLAFHVLKLSLNPQATAGARS